MERLFGRTLEARLAAGRRRGHTLGIHEALELLLAITDALAAAHRAGVAHCDLKPDNIVVIGSRVVLIDFGLFVPEVARTAPRPAAGAAEFMAPETIERRVRPGEGPLVDLYALGVIAHELLVGRTPFAAATFEETLQRHLTTTAPELHSVRPDVPRALSDLVGEILRRDPLERPTSAEEVVWRLSAVRSPSGMSAGIQPFRVLVVDDDPAIASALRRALKMAMPQLAVETETDPCAAVAEIERTPPDIVLLDLKMPRMNGIEVAMAITGMKTCGRTRIIATSEGASARDIDVLRSLGVEYFVPKDARFLARLATAINELRSA
jgi:serine/threonine-protein kinase